MLRQRDVARSVVLAFVGLFVLGMFHGQATNAGDNGTTPSTVNGPLVIENQHHQVYRNLRITSSTGDCVQVTNSSDITIEGSQIGPCGGNGVNISGSRKIQIFDSYIHPETLSPGCCDHNDGVLIQKASAIIIQGNVIAYGESNIEASYGVADLVVNGNFLLNPRGPFPRGQNAQAWTSSNIVVRNNYTLSSRNTQIYLYPDHQEDSINFGIGTGFIAQSNYITGGQSPSGCGLIADDGANSVQFTGNSLVDTGQCGIGLASGTGQVVDHNRILNRNPVPGAGNTALYVWSQYKGVACGPVTISNNIATEVRADGSQSGYWNGGGCEPVTQSGNTWNEAALALLTPVEAKLPPPLIPPLPRHCVIRSPYSTQTMWPAC